MEGSNTANLARKSALYEVIDIATQDSDDDDSHADTGRQASLRAMQNSPRPKSSKAAQSNNLSRSVSDNHLDRQAKGQLGPLKQPAMPEVLPATLATRHTFSGTPNAPMAGEKPTGLIESKVTGKRKRSDDDYVVIDEGIFSGLHFYFFPNTDKHPARKLRIKKATEHGAQWEREFNEKVTHVVMDKTLEFTALLKYLRKDRLPENVAVVSEDYPPECISFRSVLDPQQIQFKVKGRNIAPNKPPSFATSDKSLLLKAAGKSVTARKPHTPEVDVHTATSPSAVSVDDEDQGADPQLPSKTDGQRTSAAIEPSNVEGNEALEKAIKQARGLQDVPLDPDDETASRPTTSEGLGTDEEADKGGLQLMKQRKSKFQRFQDRFQCMEKHTGGGSESPNAATIAILQQMADYYGQTGDEWRIRAYRKAMATLRNHPTKVCTKEQALALPQIGERLADKIEEIASTARLRRLESTKSDPSDQVFRTFMQIYGVGPAQASKWVDGGYKTLDQLREKAVLSENQRIGLDHYEDFNTRIPREEVERHGATVRRTLQKIDPAFEVIVGGSYRRGSATSGDIDCIITRPDTGSAFIRQIVLDQLVPKLFAKKFLVAELAATSRDDGSKWHGASQIPSSTGTNLWRRIDFLLVPSDELGAALIYFTGNDIFNRSLRLLAGTKGMRLNQRGLYKDVMRGKGREKLSEGMLVEGKDEKRIFEILGVPYRPPEHRIC